MSLWVLNVSCFVSFFEIKALLFVKSTLGIERAHAASFIFCSFIVKLNEYNFDVNFFFSLFFCCCRVTHHSVRQKLILNWSNLERVHTQRSSKDTASKLEWFIVCPFDFIRIYGWNVNLYSENQWSWIYTSSLSQDILLFFRFVYNQRMNFSHKIQYIFAIG